MFDIYLFVFTCWGEGAAGGVDRVGFLNIIKIIIMHYTFSNT